MSIVGFKNLKQSRIEVRNHDAPGPLNREWGYTMTQRGKVERKVKSACISLVDGWVAALRCSDESSSIKTGIAPVLGLLTE